MTIFIYEHLTSGALAEQHLSLSLLHEGESMLSAICGDLLNLGYDVSIIRDSRLPASKYADKLTVHEVNTPEQFEIKWQQCQEEHQQFIVIAPETNNCLYHLVKTLEQKNKQVLGCHSDAISLCTDKYTTFQKLKSQHLTTPETYLVSEWLSNKFNSEKWVIKPIDGAGSEQTYVFTSTELNSYLDKLYAIEREKLIIQPFLEGENLSLTLFIDDDSHVLSINKQLMIRQHNQLIWQGCISAYQHHLMPAQIKTLIKQVNDAIPGLWGFIGIDFVLHKQTAYILDINPRLTTCYTEIGSRISLNPASYLNDYLNTQKHERK